MLIRDLESRGKLDETLIVLATNLVELQELIKMLVETIIQKHLAA